MIDNYILIFKKILRQFYNPSRLEAKHLLDKIHFLIRKITFKKNNKSNPVLVYDVRCCAPTFDFLYLICDAFLFFSKKGFSAFDLIIYWPSDYVFEPFKWNSYSKYVTGSELKDRIDDIIIPISKSFDCIKKIYIVSSQSEYDQIYPNTKLTFHEFYHPRFYFHPGLEYKRIFSKLFSENRSSFPCLIANFDKENILHKLSISCKYVTLTLRDYGYAEKRNTSTEEIQLAFQFALSIGAKLVIIPDVIKNLNNYEIPESSIIYPQAREDINERISLYAHSKLNLFMPCGPASVSVFIPQSKTVILKWGLPTSFDSSPEYYLKEYGIRFNDQPYLVLNGYLIWYEKYKYSVKQIKHAYEILNKTI